MRRQVNTLAKAELFTKPFFRSIMIAMGGIPINRKNPNIDSIKKCITLAKEGHIVLVFPQGKRCYGQNPAETVVHPGAAMIAMRSECPVIPVAIETKNMRFRFFKRTNVIIGKPMTHEEMKMIGENSTDYKAITSRIFHDICEIGGFSTTKDNIGEENDSNRP